MERSIAQIPSENSQQKSPLNSNKLPTSKVTKQPKILRRNPKASRLSFHKAIATYFLRNYRIIILTTTIPVKILRRIRIVGMKRHRRLIREQDAPKSVQ